MKLEIALAAPFVLKYCVTIRSMSRFDAILLSLKARPTHYANFLRNTPVEFLWSADASRRSGAANLQPAVHRQPGDRGDIRRAHKYCRKDLSNLN